MAAKKATKAKPAMAKGEKRCYTDENVAKRVEGRMKASGKGVSRTGRCITRTR